MSNPNPPNQFKKGQSGNPKGRPKKEWTWVGTIKRVVEEMEEVDGKKVKENVAKSLLNQCLQGNMQAIKEFGDRIDGKPQQFLDHTTGGEPFTVVTKVPDMNADDRT